jgi:quercetin dioxygenase-like cupin family protein
MSDASHQPVGSRVLFEDDVVRIWELEVGPGETFPMHHHALDYVTVTLTEGDVEAHEAGGGVRGGHQQVGDFRVAHVGPDGETHELRNIGSRVFRNRIIELKR